MEPFTRALLDRAKSLVGSVLLEVRYYDLPSEMTEGLVTGSDVAHTAHFGVDLVTDRGVVAVTSSDEFTDGTNELSLDSESIAERGVDAVATNVHSVLPWSELIGTQIVSSKIHWVESPYVVLSKRRRAFSSHHYDADGAVPFSGPQAPLALELRFDGGRALLVSGSWKGPDQQIVETGRGVSVLFEGDDVATLVPRIARQLKKSW